MTDTATPGALDRTQATLLLELLNELHYARGRFSKVTVDDLLAAIAASRGTEETQPVALDRPTPDELDDVCAAIAACGYASEAVEVFEDWTRRRWGVESAFTTKATRERAEPFDTFGISTCAECFRPVIECECHAGVARLTSRAAASRGSGSAEDGDEYIAAADPQTVMALCDAAAEVERLRALLGYLWIATGKDYRTRVCDLFDEDDPLVRDVGAALATPTAEPAVPVETEARDE